MDYQEFLKTKELTDIPTGLTNTPELPPQLFDFQRDIVRWALMRGRAAIFADCGMGKTIMQLVWSDIINKQTGLNILILAPLAVAQQTVREGQRFGIVVNYCRKQEQVNPGITIANYEMLYHFDAAYFGGVVLDESSILKSYSGKFRTQVIETFSATKFKLACTATPAPNDYMELGSHSQFLNIMSGSEMLSSFFINDPANVGRYRLKGHAQDEFWRWMASWSVVIRKPSDLGYDDGNFKLPPIKIIDHTVSIETPSDGFLFRLPASTLQERQKERKASTAARVEACAAICNQSNDQWLVWCDLNDESRQLAKSINGAVEVVGSDKPEKKEQAAIDFASGKIRVLVSKPSIFGFGLNFQHCHNMAFVGLSDSYEQFYQAVRRCWRFGQKHIVNCHVITAETEGAVVANIKRKEKQAIELAEGISKNMAYISRGEIKKDQKFAKEYTSKTMEMPRWLISA